MSISLLRISRISALSEPAMQSFSTVRLGSSGLSTPQTILAKVPILTAMNLYCLSGQYLKLSLTLRLVISILKLSVPNP